jgi:hypothetical protein
MKLHRIVVRTQAVPTGILNASLLLKAAMEDKSIRMKFPSMIAKRQ